MAFGLYQYIIIYTHSQCVFLLKYNSDNSIGNAYSVCIIKYAVI